MTNRSTSALPTPLSPRRRVSRLTASALAVAAAVVLGPRPAFAEKVHDNADLNYILHVPDSFEWGNIAPFKSKDGVEIADWRLETLKDKSKATGQGVRVLLAVSDAKDLDAHEGDLFDWQALEEEARKQDLTDEKAKQVEDLKNKIDKSLTDLANRPAVVSLLLEPFADPKPKPEVEVNERVGGIPAVCVKVEGKSANLAGNDAECHGRMFVWELRGKLFRLVMWAWPAPRDREGLKTKMDEIQFSFEHQKSEAKPKKPPPPKNEGGDSAGSKEDEEKRARKVVKDLAFAFEVVKPAKFAENPYDRATATQRQIGFIFQANQGQADVIVDLNVYRIGRQGVTAWRLDDYLPGLWASWLPEHKEGDLGTVPFPPYTAKIGFLVVPDTSKKAKIERPPPNPKAPGKIDPVTISAMERLGICGEVHNAKLGDVKTREVWRWCMSGSLPRVGEDIQAHYCFSSRSRTYVIRLISRGGGIDAYKAELTEMLSSFRITDD